MKQIGKCVDCNRPIFFDLEEQIISSGDKCFYGGSCVLDKNAKEFISNYFNIPIEEVE